MSKHKVKILMQGVDKHQLVEIDVLDVPSKIRKMYGIAKDKKQENFFRLLNFKLEGVSGTEKYYSRFFDISDNRTIQSAKDECPKCHVKLGYDDIGYSPPMAMCPKCKKLF